MGATVTYRDANGLLWPAEDVNSHTAVHITAPDMEVAYRHCRNFRVVIQAGGNCGVWPKAMGKQFDTVYTFEPDPVNFRCLCANAPAENIFKFNAALGLEHICVDLERNPTNVGAHRVSGLGPIPTFCIDDLALTVCDLIYLDIEGREQMALEGGVDTIARCRPVIVVEDKGVAGAAVGRIETWLGDCFGYRVAERAHRDVILVPW
jgi:FkbM family methyltransferase